MIFLEEINEGKKPIKIEVNESVAKKPIKIVCSEENNINETTKGENSGFEKMKKKSKFIKWIFIIGVIVIMAFVIKNTIPKDIESIKDSVVMLKVFDEKGNEISTGSGFCAYKSNYIVTNFHVIKGASSITVIDDNEKQYYVYEIEICNEMLDIAILKCDIELTPLKIGSASNLKAGENILAIGSPKGQLNTVSKGVISNADNDYEIRITAPISPR